MLATKNTGAANFIIERILPLTRENYYAMAKAGIFDGVNVELIDGKVIQMAPMLGPHATGIMKTADQLYPCCFQHRVMLRTQMPVRCDQFNEPEPDLAVVRGKPDDYVVDHPTGSDILLVVEISDSTLQEDRKMKSGLYARMGIPEYWIVNIPNRQVEVHRQPQADASATYGWTYAQRIVCAEGMTVSPPFAPEMKIPVTAVLPALTS